MRGSRIRKGAAEAMGALCEAGRLMRGAFSQTLLLALCLGVVPFLLRGFFFVRSQGTLLSVWEGWLGTALSGGCPAEGLLSMLAVTMRQAGFTSLSATLLDLAVSLLITPLLLSSLALLYNGFIRRDSEQAAIESVRLAWSNRRGLVVVALVCMAAEWFAQIVPSLASGILSLLAELLSFIPLLGSVAAVLAVLLSVLVSLLTSFCVAVAFCYVWICASCEGAGGLQALTRSWRLTRGATRATILALVGLMLAKWAVFILLGLLWLVAGRALAIPLSALIFCAYAVSGLYTAVLGATASALYLRRPVDVTGSGRQGGSPLDALKSANIH